MIKDFRQFASRGSMVDMAIGIMIGTAFGKTISSLVDNILMPPVGYLTREIDFAAMSFELPVDGADPVEIKYGLFLNSFFSLSILLVVIFVFVKVSNRFHTATEGETTLCSECKMSIPVGATRCGHCTSTIG